MKKLLIIIFVLFASSLVFLISCDKESITPLISEEDQGIIHKEGNGSGSFVCCTQVETNLTTPDLPNRYCCLYGVGCLPCVSIYGTPLYDKILQLDSLLKSSTLDIVNFFTDEENYGGLFPNLLTLEFQNYLEMLRSGNYKLIEIIIDESTNTRVYIFENTITKVQFGLTFKIE
jgi:hypothetical protein